MPGKNLRTIASVLILAGIVLGSPLPNWSEMIVIESSLENKGNDFTKKAYEFARSGEYKNFVTHSGVADKNVWLKGGVFIINNKTYLTPEFIPSNVSKVSKYDVIKAYTLFNVLYYIEVVDQDIDAILNDISVPPIMQTVQATILACVYNRDIIQRDNFTIYVYDNEELASNFNFYKGQPVGSTVLEDIHSGTGLPETKPNVVFISGDSGNYDAIINYCRENNVLTLTDRPKLLQMGVTIGIGAYSADDVKLILNTKGVSGSVDAWNSDNIFYKKL